MLRIFIFLAWFLPALASAQTCPGTPSACPSPTFNTVTAGTANIGSSPSGPITTIPTPLCNWNGTTGTDATAALQAAINLVSARNGELDLPSTPCLISAALIVPGNVTIRGQGCFENWGSVTSSYVYPVGGVSGSGFVQTTAGTDIIDITGKGITVNLLHFCGQFKTPYINTGNGIAVNPPAYNGYLDHGVFKGVWEGVTIFGVDGNHFGFNLQNTILTSLIDDRSYGGGGLRMYNNSSGYEYGNLNVQDVYVADYIAGSSDAVVCDGIATPAVNQVYSVFTRLQIWLWNAAGSGFTQPPGTTAPTNAQHLFSTGANALCAQMTEVLPDFETNISGATSILPIYNQVLNGSILSNIGNATPNLTPSSGAAVQNASGFSLQITLSMEFTTAGPPAVSIFVAPTSALVTGANSNYLVNYAADTATLSAIRYVPMTFTVPAGYYYGVYYGGDSTTGNNAGIAAESYIRVPGL